MKALVSNITKHLIIYGQLLKITVMMLLEYRLNVVVQSLYAVVYMIGMYFVILATFLKTDSIAGFTKDEVLLLFAMTMSIWAFVEAFFWAGFLQFTISDVTTGDFDKVLVKPVSSRFMVAFSAPRLEAFVYLLGQNIFLGWQMTKVAAVFTPLSVVGFVICAVLGIFIAFNMFAVYASLSFHFGRSTQVLRVLQTIGDQGVYPVTIQPKPVGAMLSSIIPSAFMGFFPVAILLQKVSWWVVVYVVFFALVSHWVSVWAWDRGLQNYSSASS